MYGMKRDSEIIILSSFFAIIGLEVLLHWFLASKGAPVLTTFYLSESKRNSITTLVDNFLPAILLGSATGWFGRQWSIRKTIVSLILLMTGIVASALLYRPFFSPELLWWWPPTTGDVVFRTLTTLFFLGFFDSAFRRARARTS
jgi:hypothetical protein